MHTTYIYTHICVYLRMCTWCVVNRCRITIVSTDVMCLKFKLLLVVAHPGGVWLISARNSGWDVHLNSNDRFAKRF